MLHDERGRAGLREARARQLQVEHCLVLYADIVSDETASRQLTQASCCCAASSQLPIQLSLQMSRLLCRLEAAAPTQHGESDAIACDPTRPEDCLTYCYVMEDGSMVSSISQALSKDRWQLTRPFDEQGASVPRISEQLLNTIPLRLVQPRSS